MKPAYKCTVELHVRAFFGARKFIILKIACESSGCGSLAILSFVLSVRLHVKKRARLTVALKRKEEVTGY